MIRPVLKWPDERLTRVAAEAVPGEVAAGRWAELVRDLRETLEAAGGCALSAPEVEVPLALFVLDPTLLESGQPSVFFNPQLELRSPPEEKNEWCLCLPLDGLPELGRGRRPDNICRVTRRPAVRMVALGENGAKWTLDLKAQAAQAAQHSFDHLRGRAWSARPARRCSRR